MTAVIITWMAHQVPWLKRLGRYALTLGLLSGGLVLFCLSLDLGFALLGYTLATLMELSELQIRLSILGGAMVFFPVIVTPEGGGSNGMLRENIYANFSHYTPR